MKPYTPQPGDVCEWNSDGEKETVLILGYSKDFEYPFNYGEDELDFFAAIDDHRLFDIPHPYVCDITELTLIHRP